MSHITDAINSLPEGVYHSYQILRNLASLYLTDEGLKLIDIRSDILRHAFMVEYMHGVYAAGQDDDGNIWIYPSEEIEYYPLTAYSIPSLHLLALEEI